MSAIRAALSVSKTVEPFERTRMVHLCEFTRFSAREQWVERLELWQIRPATLLLSAVQVYPWDEDVEECWLSSDVSTTAELIAALRAWNAARRIDGSVRREAARRMFAIVARWRPEFPDLPKPKIESLRVREPATAG